ncbi:MAG: metal ABC transporter permease [Pseudoflavonifractor sp.]|nr:metal ABC transporter permease [Alloprevotella sp.]MCM1116208.1 metal ABC transporter permease [Pseudoflavonifractor sp.]
MSLLEYDFFRNALAAVMVIAVASAVIGTYIVSRRLVSISGGITHACFGGLGLGYYLGLNPVAMAAAVAVASGLGVEWLSSRGRVREDSAIAVVWSLGMAAGVIFVFMTPGYVPELNSFLFGNLLTVGSGDLILFSVYTALLLLFYLTMRHTVIACAFDRDFARTIHLPVGLVNVAMTVFIAVGIVLTIRLVGIMLLMSMFTLPQLTAEIYARRFDGIMWLSAIISVACGVGGLMLGAVVNVPCSALIVLLQAAVYFLCRVVSAVACGIIARKN